MSPWIVLAIAINSALVLSFAWLVVRSGPGATAIALGVVHLLLAAGFSVAPFRSFFDPDYIFGEYLTLQGLQALAIMAILFVLGPTWGAWWTARRARLSVS